MRYVIARMKQDTEVMAYRFYISDGFKALTENTSGGESRSTLSMRFSDILNPVTSTEEDAKEIINRIVTRLGGTE